MGISSEATESPMGCSGPLINREACAAGNGHQNPTQLVSMNIKWPGNAERNSHPQWLWNVISGKFKLTISLFGFSLEML